MVFTLLFNFALGLITLIPGLEVNTGYYGGLLTDNPIKLDNGSINQTYLNNLNSEFQLSSTPTAKNEAGFFNSFISIVTLGYYDKIKDFSKKYFFGIIDYLFIPVFKPMLGETVSDYLFPAMRIVLGFIYFLAIFWLFTDKRIDT